MRKKVNNNSYGYIDLKKSKVLYTNGNEYIRADNREEWIGFYTITSDNRVFAGTDYNDIGRMKLLTIPNSAFDPKNKRYHDLTTDQFDRYNYPPYYFPTPTSRDYKRGTFFRYFVKKINEDIIIEISPEQADKINNRNAKGINSFLWSNYSLRWTISGPINDVRKANERVLLLSRQYMPGLSKYLGDLDEFHETKPIVQRQTLDREYPDGEKMHPNLPAAYGFSNQKNQACSNCIFKNNNACKLWQANIRNNYWCGRWKAIPNTTY